MSASGADPRLATARRRSSGVGTRSKRSPSRTSSASQTTPAGTRAATPARAGWRDKETSRIPATATVNVTRTRRRSRRGPGGAPPPGIRSPEPARANDQPAPPPARGRAGTAPQPPCCSGTAMLSTPVSVRSLQSEASNPAGSAAAHPVGEGRPSQQPGECRDQLLLLPAQREVHVTLLRNSGGRFSAKARIASAMSLVPRFTFCATASASSAWRRDDVVEILEHPLRHRQSHRRSARDALYDGVDDLVELLGRHHGVGQSQLRDPLAAEHLRRECHLHGPRCRPIRFTRNHELP